MLTVITHGLGSSSQSENVKILNSHLRSFGCIPHNFDFPGHGEDARNAELFTLTDAVESLRREVLKQEGKVLLLGRSMGGIPSVQIAKEFSDKIAGLILMNTPLSFTDKSMKRKYWFLAPFMHFGFLPYGFAKRRLPVLLKLFLRDAEKYNLINDLPMLRVPTLIVSSENDWLIPKTHHNFIGRLPETNPFIKTQILQTGHGIGSNISRSIAHNSIEQFIRSIQ